MHLENILVQPRLVTSNISTTSKPNNTASPSSHLWLPNTRKPPSTRVYQPNGKMSRPDRIATTLVHVNERATWFDKAAQVDRMHSNRQSILVWAFGSIDHSPEPVDKPTLGVYFGRKSERNIFTSIPDIQVQTDDAAALYAAIMALETVQSSEPITDLKLIIMSTNSSYLCAAINKRVWNLENGAKKGAEPAISSTKYRHAELILDLHEICKQLEGVGIQVKYWYQSKRESLSARGLSKATLESVMGACKA